MQEKNAKKTPFKKKLLTKRRLVILNEDTFEEIFSFKLNLMNVFVSLTLGAIFLVLVTTYIIAFTPLREWIPGYSSSELKRNAVELALRSDSLKTVIQKNELYLKSVQKVLKGELEYAKFSKDSIMADVENQISEDDLKASQEELDLRADVKQEEELVNQAKNSNKQTKK